MIGVCLEWGRAATLGWCRALMEGSGRRKQEAWACEKRGVSQGELFKSLDAGLKGGGGMFPWI